VLEQKIELPHIPQIDENEFEDMKYNVRQLKGKSELMQLKMLSWMNS